MASSTLCTLTSETPSTMKEAIETPKTTNSCGIPGCFTCANGEKHAPLLTPFEEFLSIMQTHKDALLRGSANIESRLKAIRAERLDPNVEDLESGHDELRELVQVLFDYSSALDSAEDEVLYAKRAGMYGDSDSEEEEEEDEEEEVEEKVELAESKEEVKVETPAPVEAEAPKEEAVSIPLPPSLPETPSEPSEDQPLHPKLLSRKLADVLVKAETEEVKPKGSVGQSDFIGADPYSLDEEEEEEQEEEEGKKDEEDESPTNPPTSVGLAGSRWACLEE